MPRRRGQSPPVEGNARPAVNSGQGMLVRPEPMKKDGSVDDYVRYFERVMAANEWDDETAVKVFLAMIPPGERSLDAIDGADTFAKIKTAIQTNQIPYREANLQALMSMKKEDHESTEIFHARVSKQIELVYPKYDPKTQRELTRDFFLYGLPHRVREGVITARATTLEDTVNAARMMESLQKTSGIVYNLDSEKSVEKELPQNSADRPNQRATQEQCSSECTYAMTSRHDAHFPKENRSNNPLHRNFFPQNRSRAFGRGQLRSSGRVPADVKRIRCYVCQGYGHYQYNCPTRFEMCFGSKSESQGNEN